MLGSVPLQLEEAKHRMIHNHHGYLGTVVSIIKEIPSTNKQITNNIQIRISNDPNKNGLNTKIQTCPLVRKIIAISQCFGH